MSNFLKVHKSQVQNDVSGFWQTKSRSTSSTFALQNRSPYDLKVTLYAADIRSKIKAGQTLTQIPFLCDEETLSLLLYSFSKANRNQNDILLIEHYLITFPNLMKTIYQKKYLYDASELLHKIAIYLKCEQINKNTLVCRLGEIGDKFYLIFQGSVGILIPRELKFKLSEEEFLSHLYKLFYLKEYELTLRTISSNNHIYMGPEIYQLKTKLENDDSLYNACHYRESISINEYIERLNPEVTHNEPSNLPTITVWSYYYVTNITQGQTFGDIALSDDAKRRTATIIAIENAYCGTLDITVYKNCIKDAQERIRKMNIHFLLGNKILNGIGSEFFDKKYFNFFKHVTVKRSDVLFSQLTPRKDIFFLKEGEIELYTRGTFVDLNNILKAKGEQVNTRGEIYMTKKNPSFKRFYYEMHKTFKLFSFSSKEIIGLDEIIYKDNLFLCSARCISEKAELFAIENNVFLDIIKQERRKERLSKYIELKNKIIIERIKKIKQTKIEKRFLTFEGDKNKTESHKLVPNKQYYLDLLENNRKHFLFEQVNFPKKRLYSAGNTIERKSNPSINHNQKGTDSTITSPKNLFKNVKRMSLKTESNYIPGKAKNENKSIFSIFSLNKIQFNNNNMTNTKTESNEVLTDYLYRDIIDKAILKSNLSFETKTSNNSYQKTINFLAVDEAIEQKYSLTKNNSYSSFMEKNKKQLTIEQKGNKKMLKYIKPPLPKIEVE